MILQCSHPSTARPSWGYKVCLVNWWSTVDEVTAAIGALPEQLLPHCRRRALWDSAGLFSLSRLMTCDLVSSNLHTPKTSDHFLIFLSLELPLSFGIVEPSLLKQFLCLTIRTILSIGFSSFHESTLFLLLCSYF